MALKEYLGRTISSYVKELRGFLGLFGYNLLVLRMICQRDGVIAQPLLNYSKGEDFSEASTKSL